MGRESLLRRMPDGTLGDLKSRRALGVDYYRDTMMVDRASVLTLLIHFEVSMCFIVYSCLKQTKVRSIHSYNTLT
jgi:hypothetical protein